MFIGTLFKLIFRLALGGTRLATKVGFKAIKFTTKVSSKYITRIGVKYPKTVKLLQATEIGMAIHSLLPHIIAAVEDTLESGDIYLRFDDSVHKEEFITDYLGSLVVAIAEKGHNEAWLAQLYKTLISSNLSETDLLSMDRSSLEALLKDSDIGFLQELVRRDLAMSHRLGITADHLMFPVIVNSSYVVTSWGSVKIANRNPKSLYLVFEILDPQAPERKMLFHILHPVPDEIDAQQLGSNVLILGALMLATSYDPKAQTQVWDKLLISEGAAKKLVSGATKLIREVPKPGTPYAREMHLIAKHVPGKVRHSVSPVNPKAHLVPALKNRVKNDVEEFLDFFTHPNSRVATWRINETEEERVIRLAQTIVRLAKLGTNGREENDSCVVDYLGEAMPYTAGTANLDDQNHIEVHPTIVTQYETQKIPSLTKEEKEYLAPHWGNRKLQTLEDMIGKADVETLTPVDTIPTRFSRNSNRIVSDDQMNGDFSDEGASDPSTVARVTLPNTSSSNLPVRVQGDPEASNITAFL
jgi:hypothetical protein